MKQVDVLIVDDHPAMSFGTKLILEHMACVREVWTASDGASAIREWELHKPGLVLLDLALPDEQGLDIAKALRSRSLSLRILIYTGEEQMEAHIDALINLQIHGLIHKSATLQHVERAIEAALDNQAVLPASVFHCLRLKANIGLLPPTDLREKELELLRLVIEGYTNIEIAQTLYVSAKTVESHLTQLYRKLGVGSRQEAAHRANVWGLLKSK